MNQNSESPLVDPHIDPSAAARWAAISSNTTAPWLHQEVATRMAERLDYILLPTNVWLNASGAHGGVAKHKALKSKSVLSRLQSKLGRPKPVSRDSQDMVWSNMQLHMSATPQALMQDWHSALKVGGFLMFSCLGPDTLIELRNVYAKRGWAPAAHTLTDMHDWGDRLVGTGFGQPVMDSERLTLTFANPERALQELRELGRNLSPARSSLTRARAWHRELLGALDDCRNPEGQIALTFELIYGHAIKPEPKIKVDGVTNVSLEEMRRMLQKQT